MVVSAVTCRSRRCKAAKSWDHAEMLRSLNPMSATLACSGIRLSMTRLTLSRRCVGLP